MKIKDKYKVVFVTTGGGDHSYAKDFKYAAERMGWEVQVYEHQLNTYEKEVLAFDPDFILYGSYTDHNLNTEIATHRSRKYLSVHTSLQRLRDRNMVNHEDVYTIDDRAKNLLFSFHGVLAIPTEMDIYRILFQNLNKPFNGIGVLSTTPMFINEPAEPVNLT